MSAAPFQFIASAPRGFSDLVARELESFGAQGVRDRSTGVLCTGDLELVYRVCLWSRVVNRLFLEMARFDAPDAEAFYSAARALPWVDHIRASGTIACDFTGRHPTITNTQFGALKLKDAIVDSLRDASGQRPSVKIERPDVRIHAHAQGTTITVSLDLSGESLHRRGYRGEAGEAPVKENLAAGILMRAGWPNLAAEGAAFLDPLCGSGTFVIEAAMMAAGIAPGAYREYFGFLGWRGHDSELWTRLRTEARAARDPARRVANVISGRDRDPGVIRIAQANSRRAGVDAFVRFEEGELESAAPFKDAGRERVAVDDPESAALPGDAKRVSLAAIALQIVTGDSESAALARDAEQVPVAANAPQVMADEPGSPAQSSEVDRVLAFATSAPHTVSSKAERDAPTEQAASQTNAGATTASSDTAVARTQAVIGLVCANPPYGVRLEDRERARAVHRELGKVLREQFAGWQAVVLTGAPEMGLELGIRAYRTHTVWNGSIECRLLRMNIEAQSFRDISGGPGSAVRRASNDTALRESAGAQMFANRLAKNIKRLRSWADRSKVSCYRLYDADMPEYSFAIDRYRLADSDTAHLYVQEYAAPSSIDEESVRRRRAEAMSVLPDVTGVRPEHIHLRMRRKVVRGDQYRKVADRASFHVVEEDGLRLEVNFDDYLDTGLFLDHRLTRSRIRKAAQGKRFLNLFAYTGTATVHAAAGGAKSSLSIDLSRTYIDWARRNLALNQMGTWSHEFLQADCREWLAQASRGDDRFDLIFLDPPTFSNSKRMEGVLDIQRDHSDLIDGCLRILSPGGLLIFSTNAQRFRLDESLGSRCRIRDISGVTLPEDFARNPKIHQAFELTAATP
jgi:23S rRNA G2445 N2-methylase RlmL/23S rRNA G2069 N7-methylase RlmK/C1962 C5-methylase RlmI